MKKILVCAGVLSFVGFQAHALKLYLVSNHDKVGDHNQALGIEAAVKKLSRDKVSVEDLNAKTITSAEIKQKLEQDLPHEKVIYVGTGEGGINGLAEVSKAPNLTTCLTSHMFLPQYKDDSLLAKVDIIALPAHLSSDEKKELGAKLVETTGVAHNRHADMATYDEWKKELPPADIYLGVYLGGDAPNQAQEIKHFTEEDATRLADYVIGKAKELRNQDLDVCVLVLNGPRTGKHDGAGKEILTAHREGKADHITEAFGEKLADKGIEHKIFDFQYDTPENKKWVASYNAFDLVTGAVRTTKGKMIVPGESTSVVSETIDIMPSEAIETMPPGKAVVYHNSAMDKSHIDHVVSELDAGRVSILENYQEIKAPQFADAEPKPGATTVIAKKLLAVASVEEVPTETEKKVEKTEPNEEATETKAEETEPKAVESSETPKTTKPSTAETAPNATAAPEVEKAPRTSMDE